MQFLKSQLPGVPVSSPEKQVMNEWHENSSLMFMVLKVYEMGSLNFMGGAVSFLPCSMELILRLKNLLMLLGTLVQTVIFTSVSINDVFPFILPRIAIFTCAPWSHLSEEGQDIRL